MQTHTTDRTFAPAESIALAPRAGPLAFFFGGVLIAAIMARTVTLAGREVVFGSRNVTFQNSDGNAQDPARHVRRLGLDEPVTDQQPRAILEGLYAKAAEGDTAAARLVYELARIQREDEAR